MKIRLITAALGLAALMIIPMATASAAATHAARPPIWNYVWKPGTPLPKIGPDQVLDAWPVQSAMGKMKTGQSVPIVKIGYTTTSGHYVPAAGSAAVKSVTGTDGLVNLQAAPQVCGTPQLIKKLGLRYVAVATTFSLIRPVTQDFDYSQGQSSTLEVGYSTTGKYGSLSELGYTSVSSNDNQSFPANNLGNERYLTEFAFAKYEVKCESGKATPDAIAHYYEVKPYEWAGGDSMDHPKSAPTATYCVTERANSKHSVTFSKHSTTAVTFSAGFSILGFTGSSQTGYDVDGAVTFTWAKKSQGHLCGTNDYPAGTPKMLVAKR